MPMILKIISFKHETISPREKMQRCFMGESAWMTGSKLKLNLGKTKFLLIGSKLQWEKMFNNFPCLTIGQYTNPSASAKNLGVVFDSSLNFWKHISQTCIGILDLRRIRRKSVLSSCWKLNYCNSLFHNFHNFYKRTSLDYNVFRTVQESQPKPYVLVVLSLY